ncbi:MAG: universal stress protein [Nitrososphaerales archaeon]
MTAYRKILVPHDGSEMSDKALKHALTLARATKARLLIVTVIPKTIRPIGLYLSESPGAGGAKRIFAGLKEMVRKETADKLSKLSRQCEKQGVKAEYRIVEGYAVDKIIDTVQKQEIDLVVMGSHSLIGVKRIKALGSVARSVSEHCTCPVLIVH